MATVVVVPTADESLTCDPERIDEFMVLRSNGSGVQWTVEVDDEQADHRG